MYTNSLHFTTFQDRSDRFLLGFLVVDYTIPTVIHANGNVHLYTLSTSIRQMNTTHNAVQVDGL